MDQLQPGQMLGAYRILNQIGQGGMATVYKAYQPSMDRNVAIKVLPSQLAESSEFTQRFQQEAHIIAKLEHPHILPIFDYGESDGVTYFVMRYLDAGTLKDIMEKERPIPLQKINRLFTQLADALSYAHSQGVVHRDLKPSNALVDSQGNLFLTDFGIAKILESASPRLTQTDAIMGTPAYISPEQAQAQTVDQRSDIYSLGIILYEMVTGRVPYVAETPLAVILKHVSDPLPPPSVLKPDIPEAIEQVILKALAKNPDDRFDTVAEFSAAWKRALAETGSSSRPAETVSSPISHTEAAAPERESYTPQTQGMPAPASTPSSRFGGRTGLIAGCFVAACALFGLVGLGFIFLNLGNTSTTATQTIPPPTHTAVPAQPTATLAPTVTPPPSATETPASSSSNPNAIFQDDFSDNTIWGTLKEANDIIQYDSGKLRMQILKKNWIVWSTPNGGSFDNVHIEVTAYNNDGESTTAFGILCDQQDTNSSYYYAVFTPGGEYAIVLAADGKDDVFLTNNDQWGSSNLIKRNASSYRIGMDCGNGTLALYVDGKLIDSASDSTYTSGVVGLTTWSGENVSSADVSFDDFMVTPLK